MVLRSPKLAAAGAAIALTFSPLLVAADDGSSARTSLSAATATSVPTEAMSAQARAEYEAFLQGRVDRSHYSLTALSSLSDATVATISGHLRSHGPIQRFVYQGLTNVGGDLLYAYRVTAATPPDVLELITWDGDGKVKRVMFGDAPS